MSHAWSWQQFPLSCILHFTSLIFIHSCIKSWLKCVHFMKRLVHNKYSRDDLILYMIFVCSLGAPASRYNTIPATPNAQLSLTPSKHTFNTLCRLNTFYSHELPVKTQTNSHSGAVQAKLASCSGCLREKKVAILRVGKDRARGWKVPECVVLSGGVEESRSANHKCTRKATAQGSRKSASLRMEGALHSAGAGFSF